MTLRISVEDSRERCSIHIAGRLVRDGLPDLENALSAAPAGACLDLSQMMSMDSWGAAALRRLRASGVELVGLHPGLAWKLEEDVP